MPEPELLIEMLPHAEGLEPPSYKTGGAAGLDLRAALRPKGPLSVLVPKVYVGERTLIPTGLRMAIPHGFEGQIRPRSGLALKHGITVANAPGTIDSDYRGEIQVILINHGATPFAVEHGMRIAQLVVAPVARAHVARLAPGEKLSTTLRGEGGFGHTGTD